MYDLRERNDFGRFENSRVRKIQIPVHFELRTVAIPLVFIGSENNFLGISLEDQGTWRSRLSKFVLGFAVPAYWDSLLWSVPTCTVYVDLSLSISDE